MAINRISNIIVNGFDSVDSVNNNELLEDEISVPNEDKIPEEIVDTVHNDSINSEESVEDMLNILEIKYEYIDNVLRMFDVETNKEILNETVKILFMFYKDLKLDDSTIVKKYLDNFDHSSSITHNGVMDVFFDHYVMGIIDLLYKKKNFAYVDIAIRDIPDYNDVIYSFKSIIESKDKSVG